ncbi:hypothetical protein CSUB01_12662 [Colletotrichum sublineola]|uniref:Uncharacterized protein n=1 Tax=Colletotrichum sublineola TaxID=1173701 RepID=A0A066XMF7_COLSU|nr:hypothetical protein CSUB01_12662 [Colletotrichum sublineola]
MLARSHVDAAGSAKVHPGDGSLVAAREARLLDGDLGPGLFGFDKRLPDVRLVIAAVAEAFGALSCLRHSRKSDGNGGKNDGDLDHAGNLKAG